MRVFKSALIGLTIIVGTLGSAVGGVFGVCNPNTAYVVTFSAPPPTANWTTTSGALWQPSGGFPGCATGDSASSTNVSPTTIVINSSIPNGVAAINFNAPGSVIQVDSGAFLMLDGPMSLTGGSKLVMNGGQLIIRSGGSFTANASNFQMNSGTLEVDTGGSFTVQSGSTATINGGTLDSAGSINIQSGGTLAIGSGAFFVINGGSINGDASSGVQNSGQTTVNASGAVISTAYYSNQTAASTLEVQNGTFSISGGGTANGPITIDSGATLDFPGGSYTMGTGGTVSGQGTFSITGGSVSIGGVTSPAHFILNAGTLDGPGFLSVTSTMAWSGGTIQGSGGAELAGGAMASWDGALGNMQLTSRTFNVYGFVTYSATTNPLCLSSGATLNIYGNFNIVSDGSINDVGGSSVIRLEPNGIMGKTAGSGVMSIHPAVNNDTLIFADIGTIEFRGGGTHTGEFFADYGATMQFASNSNSFNSGLIDGDGVVSFISGSHDVGATIYIGRFENTGASVSINTPATTYDFLLSNGGTLSLNALFCMNGTGSWLGGGIGGSGETFKVGSSATLTIDVTNADANLGPIYFKNYGTVYYTGTSVAPESVGRRRAMGSFSGPGDIHMLGTQMVNKGLFDIQTDRGIIADAPFVGDSVRSKARPSEIIIFAPPPTIENDGGTFQKSAGAGTTNVEPAFTNDGTLSAQIGTLSFDALTQNSGSITLGGGNIDVGTTLALNGGTLDGSGTITADVNNSGGNVSPGNSPGTINITGNYTQGSTGTMTIELAGTGAGQFDQVNVSGSATLDGTLNVSLLSYTPNNGDTWPPLTFSSRTGDFAVKNLPTFNGTHGTIVPSYTPTSLVLTAAVTPQSTDLSIGITAPPSVNAGATLSYTVVVTNNGPDPTSGTTTVVDTLPAGVSGATGSGTGWLCNTSAGTVTCTSTDAINAANTFPSITISMTAPSNAGTANNSATVSNANDGNGTNNTANSSTTVNGQADLSISKTSVNGVTAGQNITFTVTVTNNGPSTANNVVVSDPTPPNLTFVSNTGGCTSVYPCNLGPLTNGQVVTITSTYSTSASFSGNITNTASVSSTTTDPNNTNDSASKTINVGAQADLAVTKSGPASANTGQNITYTVSVKNNGPSPATSVVVNDATPVGLAFISNTGGCATPYPCNLGTLNSGQTVSITSTYNIPPSYTGSSVSNTASASSAVSDPNSTNDSSTAVTAVGAQTDLQITKSGPTTASPGQNITYTIVVTNGGGTAAPNVTVTDPTPAGTTFVSNTGACATPFPCNLGTLNPNQSATITSTFNVPAGFTGTQVTNTATVGSSIGDPNNSNNTSAFTTNIVPFTGNAPSADLKVFKGATSQVVSGGTATYSIEIYNNGPSAAANVVVTDPTPPGMTFVSNSGVCTTPYPCNLGTLGSGIVVRIISTYSVQAPPTTVITNTAAATSSTADPNGANNSSSATVTVVAQPTNNCSVSSAAQIAPASGASVSSPTTFSWTAVPGATNYVLSISGPNGTQNIITSNTSAVVTLVNGSYFWAVATSFGNNCPTTNSTSLPFTVCTAPPAPQASVVGESASGQTYTVLWNAVDTATGYELQESVDAAFSNPTTFPLATFAKTFTKNVTTAAPFFYRVRSAACGQFSSFSPVVSVVIVPLPKPGDINIGVNAPVGSTQPITFQVFIPGLPSGPTSFVATADKPWMAVTPTNGIVPPEGVNVTVSVDPTGLPNGTWTGTIIVVYGTPAATGRASTEVTQAASVPISISLVTPVSPSPLAAAAGALVVPSVGHLAGAAQWQSDIRIANVTTSPQKYMVTFNSGTGDPGVPVKQTNVSVDAGATMALDDIVRNWFGVGSLGDSANGMLLIQQLDNAGKILTNDTITKTTAVTSRTFNVASTGTLGQFIPAIPFANFLSSASSTISLQQLAQSSAFRTNIGIAEAAGVQAPVILTAFDGGGNQVLNLPMTLKPGQLLQLSSVLSQNGVTSLANGRAEVKVASTNSGGRVTAYASVVDNASNDPFFVPPVTLSSIGFSRYVIPGVADLTSPIAAWRTDVRAFNSSASTQTATFTFYPFQNPGGAVSKDVSIAPGEVHAFDNVLQSLFGLQNTGGALHMTAPQNTPFIVTARTYNQTSAGTLGQFITAVTPNDAVGAGDRSLQILQAEESPRYRTNLGIVEVTGKPVTVEVVVTLPDSRVSPRLTLSLAAFEARQIAILHDVSIGNIYNARISVRVTDGTGKVTAYASVVDQQTQAPTYIPAQ